MKRLCSLLCIGLLAACTESTVDPVSTSAPTARSMADMPASNVDGTFIIAGSTEAIGLAAAAVADAGGTIVRSHDEAGVLIASDIGEETVSAIAGLNGIQTVAADALYVEEPVTMGAPVSMATELAHDPTQAFFYQIGYQWDMEIIQADAAWNAGASAEGVTVAILDSGIDNTHQDLAGLVDESRSIAFVPNANPAIPAWGDDRYHGTHVAGTVATNGLGTAGVAPHATLLAVKVCFYTGSCPFSAIFSGIIYSAEVGADVINMSLGGFVPRSGGEGELNSILNRVMNYANRRGVTVVSAAGNAAVDLDRIGRDYGGKQNGGVGSVITVPCESGNGLCVSATNYLDEPTGYTNYGSSAISVGAPGGEGGPPYLVLSPCTTQSVVLPFACGPATYLWLAGTSMASPHVAGAAALLAAQGMNSAQIKAAIQQSADDLGKRGVDPFYGKGRLNVFNAVN
ncbi:MAG TPA: S8 family serine peptidase [Longimicrobiales bacterium]|nr:S8 family serine peptidase [Longimicrobiales bacterium]